MKHLLWFVALAAVLGSSSFADVVKLRGGITIVNCFVSDTTDNRITVQTTQQVRRYILQLVEEVVKSPYDPGRETEYFEAGAKVTPQLAVPITPATPLRPGETTDRARKTAIGIVLLAGAVVTTVFALKTEKVTLRVSATGINLSYAL